MKPMMDQSHDGKCKSISMDLLGDLIFYFLSHALLRGEEGKLMSPNAIQCFV